MDEVNGLLASVDKIRDEIIEFHRDLVRFETVNTGVMPTGNETPCCEYLRKSLDAEGIESEILESAPGRGNLIGRLKGSGGAPRLLFMSHLDVVPVEAVSAWRFPPFAAEVADGKIWGRGSDDCKAVTTAAYFATTLLRRHRVPLRGDVILTGTADEEAGGFYGYGWLARHHPDKIRADFALNEGGGVPLLSRKGLLYNLSLGEKGRVEVTVTISGRSGHASRPWAADNALVKAARAVTALAGYVPQLDLSHPVFDNLGEIIEGLSRPTPEKLEGVLQEIQRADPATAVLLRGASRMTLTPTMLHAGIKSNSIPAVCTVRCDSRTLPGQDESYVKHEAERMLQDIDGVGVAVDTWARSTQSPYGTPFTRILERALNLALHRDDARLLPSLAIGFTDSQYVRPLGVQTYGFAPLHPEADRKRPGIHGVNEVIEIESLLLRTKVFLAVAYMTCH